MNAGRFEIRGWHVLAGMLAFFGAIIAVNVTFAVFAFQTFPGEDVRRSYLQGLNYNTTLADRRAQAALGWRSMTSLRPDPDGAVVEVTLLDRDGAAISGATVNGALQWPTTAQFDRALAFVPAGGGRYVARLGALEHGRWRLRAQAQGESGALDFEAELTWPPSQ